jgi:hypothetical protein
MLLLEEGMCAEDLLNAIGIRGTSDTLTKGNPNHVPAGNGRKSGEFASGSGEGSGAPATDPTVRTTAAVAAAARTTPSFVTAGISAEALAALGTFALSLGGATAVFGTLFVPTPNSATATGPVPGIGGLTYEYNRDEGVLRLRDATGEIVAGGPRDRSGIFHDADTGIAIGRDIGTALVFDQTAMVEAAEGARAVSRTRADAEAEEESEPKLCPEPTPEPWNKASYRAKAYQEQISALVNPHRKPLAYGMAVAFYNPKTGRWVRLDECDEQNGALIEAKGPGFAKFLGNTHMQDRIRYRFLKQATAQVEAAGARSVRWYFAEGETAAFARDLFAKTIYLGRIRVIHVEAFLK